MTPKQAPEGVGGPTPGRTMCRYAFMGAALGVSYLLGAYHGYARGGAQMRDAILCVGLGTVGDTDPKNRRYCNKLGIDFAQGQARAFKREASQ